MTRRRAGVLLLVGLIASSLATVGPAEADGRGGLGDYSEKARTAPTGDAFDVLGSWSAHQAGSKTPTGTGVATNIEWDYQFIDACVLDDSGLVPDSCEFRLGIGAPVCADGQTPRAPMWSRFRVPPSETWSEWEQQDYGSCDGAQVLPVLTAEEFRRPPLPAPVLHVQPEGTWVLTNIETIVYTDPTPVTLTTQVLGLPVTVEATPSQFTYAWGDGHETVTRDPGRPYPAFDVVHEYEAPGTVAIT